VKPRFRVRILHFAILREIEGVWTSADFAAMLDQMNFGDTAGMSDQELREMCLLSLQDSEPEVAAAILLKQHLGNRLTEGQIRNAAGEMTEDKLWEEYADMSLHEGMFNVGSLAHAAFPGSFPEPDAVNVKLEVVAENTAGREILARPLHESFLVRLLADGMEDDSVLHRLFDEQLGGSAFPEADTIVWIVDAEANGADTVTIEVTSSGYWLDALRDTSSYESSACPDDGR
jgi:hypothetical protein